MAKQLVLISVLAAVAATSQPAAAQGPVTGIRMTVVDELGKPAAYMSVHGPEGARLGETDENGQVTVKYDSRIDQGRQVIAVQIDRYGEREIHLAPEGLGGVGWMGSSFLAEGGTRQGLGPFNWGGTPTIALTLKPELVAPGSEQEEPQQTSAGPQQGDWFAGPAVARNFEREAFMLGAEFGLFLGPQAFGALFANIQLSRTGTPSGALWGVAPGVGVVPSSLELGSQMMMRFFASVVYNRFSGEFVSGSEVGGMFTAGLIYGMTSRAALGVDLSAQRVGGFTQFLVGVTLLAGPNGPWSTLTR